MRPVGLRIPELGNPFALQRGGVVLSNSKLIFDDSDQFSGIQAARFNR